CLLSRSGFGCSGLPQLSLLHGGGHRDKEETDVGDVDDSKDHLLYLDDRYTFEMRTAAAVFFMICAKDCKVLASAYNFPI
ncbi:MAG: hypothetical protein IKH68_05470, partial [Erysipelotrichaceae bacterium]|nr:hypothetical protein [Erysipelotrichaceae bacterium]